MDARDLADKEYGPPLVRTDDEDTDPGNDVTDSDTKDKELLADGGGYHKEYATSRAPAAAAAADDEGEVDRRLDQAHAAAADQGGSLRSSSPGSPFADQNSISLPGTVHDLPRTPDPPRTADTQNTAHLRRRETRLAVKEAHPWQHLGITLGLPMIILFDVVVPCVIYYSWYRAQRDAWLEQCWASFPGQHPCPAAAPEFDGSVLGSAIASFGVGELWILLARTWRLFVHPEVCAPLLSTSRWQLDATSWVYAMAMIVALVPFLVGSALVLPRLYLYGPSFLMGFLGILMVVTTLHPFNIPIGINSQPKGTPLRPFIYYAAEDFMAVDGLQDREFRERYNDRYATNPMFRRFFFNLTLWWTLGVCVYIGSVSAVIWTLEFHYAFGLSLGILFSYISCWAIVTFVWTKIEMKREHEAYERGDFDV